MSLLWVCVGLWGQVLGLPHTCSGEDKLWECLGLCRRWTMGLSQALGEKD